MASLLQGEALPDVKTSQTTTTTAPDWYDKFLSGLDTSGTDAITKGGIAGASGLQTEAYNAAPTAIRSGLPTLNLATNAATDAAGAPDIAQFMNPYTSGVVNEIGRLGSRNYNEYLKPAATSATVGTGSFGSRRGLEVQGQVGRDVAADVLGKQSTALQSGYQNAVQAALQAQQNKTQAANALGTLSGQEYTQGVGGLDVLSKLGAQQQATEQAKLNYPMTAQQNFANLLRGFTIPTTQTQKYEGPMPGAYSNSPLSQIASLLTGTAGIFANKVNSKGVEIPGSSIYDTISKILDKFKGSKDTTKTDTTKGGGTDTTTGGGTTIIGDTSEEGLGGGTDTTTGGGTTIIGDTSEEGLGGGTDTTTDGDTVESIYNNYD